MSKLNVLDPTGHTAVEWDVADQATVDAARETYVKKAAEGYMAYSVAGETREQIRDFDASAEEIVMMRALMGG